MKDHENFIKSLKICWIKRMIEPEDNGILKSIYLSKPKPFGEKYYLNVTSLKTIYIDLRKTFLKDILTAWCKCNEHPVIRSYRHEILRNNSDVKVEDNRILYTNWFSNEIK